MQATLDSAPDPRRQGARMSGQRRGITGNVFVGIAAVLFVVSLWLVAWSAGEKPFCGDPSVSDGLLNVGLGSVLVF